jgi:predicted ATPase
MRLRYFRLQHYPPLTDIGISFSAESPLQRQCQIHFVVGVNGSGKTHLLQALTETFFSLARQKRPHFPVTLIYEIGRDKTHQTVLFDNPDDGGDLGWWTSHVRMPVSAQESGWRALIEQVRMGVPEWEPLIENGTTWPGERAGLPRTVLAYTTGAQESWEALFRQDPPAVDVGISLQAAEDDSMIERPAGWTRTQEIAYQAQQEGEALEKAAQELRRLEEEASGQQHDQDVCLLITPALLKFALLAVTVPLAMQEFRIYETDQHIATFITQLRQEPNAQPGIRRLLAQVGWVWPVSVSLSVDFRPHEWTTAQRAKLWPFFSLATTVIREIEPSAKRRLFFDLKARPRDSVTSAVGETIEYVGDGLLDSLGGRNGHPFDHFKMLLGLYRERLLDDVQIALRKTDTDDILLFDELSDGEQVFLGRMALFHLMEGQEDTLIILDEPETHFNDKWKREIVGIIDEVLRETGNAVLISTHSSIALTDVFNDEIVLFEKQDGESKRIEIASTTFGADPSEVMIRLFGIPDSVGQRATAWLEQKIKEGEWQPEQKDELTRLIQKIGPGFYRSELRAILKRLEDVASNQDS